MTSLEKKIHSVIKHCPALREFVVASYQRVCSVVPVTEFQVNNFIHRDGYFYGFHDKCPWSHDNTKLLAHKFDSNKAIRNIEGHPIVVGYFEDPELLFFNPIGTTYAWNWQQGSMLQWLGCSDFIVYNDIVNEKPCAKIVDLSGRELSVISGHVADISHNAKWAISYSYKRLGAGMKGYGYNSKYHSNMLEEGKMFLTNLIDGTRTEIADINKIIQTPHRDPSHDYFYYAQFSPNDERISFFCRARLQMGGYDTSLFTSDVYGNHCYACLGNNFSHKIWFDNVSILSYFKPIVSSEIGFYLIKDKGGGFERIGEKYLTSDGHPHLHSCTDGLILLDTYPDRFRMQYLKLYDIESNRQSILLRKRIPFQFRYERRCDYHPRYDRLKQKVCFDSGHSGIRAICVMDLPS
ncbi:hypothetical protein [Geomonas azotofigens]|uniref:hypothetical protein n=1 Tax=Geomonas azotofigens TaxID=2843196 RepID=UPI001C128D6A|nr:hypothetical protein [Geomonas azotofigens]MBU5612952.1 hypothetical protein [Geomonas azotofigens]